MPDLLFVGAGALAVLFAGLLLFQRTLLRSAMCLWVVLLQSAILFAASGSPLLGLLQFLLYAGAIMVLVVVAILSSPRRLERLVADTGLPRWLWAAGLSAPFALTGALALWGAPWTMTAAPGGLDRELASVLFGRYAVITAALGALILLAALAAVPAARGGAAADERRGSVRP